MIDIIIPAYNAIETIEYTLMSIAMQTIINKIKVYIIDDNSICDYKQIVNKFSKIIDITLIRLDDNVGSGKSREYGIKISNNDYILFLDSDDLFKNPESLQVLHDEILKGYDYVSSMVYSEKFDSIYSNDGDLHGKIYKRSFLENNNIHFNDSRIHEDNLFNNMVLLHNPNRSEINEVTYIYNYNKNSVTHNPLEDEFERLEIYIENMNQVIDKCEKDKCDEELIIDYILKKYNYLSYIYKTLSKEKKTNLKLLLNKHNFKHYLNKIDLSKIKLIEELL